ncbi:hypothetical protein HPG02_00980 [Pediococcus pentosaceus]|uniref:hypothetical protein n=1 Tax=Pediococcus pentosaceus TaxID=1255 RepID=UPI001C1EC297|nr:hypothetical protein [Pediococcus pentosaceus]MBU7002212.1 hypothetical protein [Pediococcus pentosaceus]MCG9226680.1 hypothetical protein [Pediococcus pentosaceus]MDA8036908.1 hypothetical protein [Pediococcus pentosaceus]
MNFKEWFLKYGIWVFLVVMLFFPWVIGVVIGFIPNLGSIGTQSEWLSFWGSYAGAIIAVLGVYWQVSKQTQESKKDLESTKKNDFDNQLKLFDLTQLGNMLALIGSYQEDIEKLEVKMARLGFPKPKYSDDTYNAYEAAKILKQYKKELQDVLETFRRNFTGVRSLLDVNDERNKEVTSAYAKLYKAVDSHGKSIPATTSIGQERLEKIINFEKIKELLKDLKDVGAEYYTSVRSY